MFDLIISSGYVIDGTGRPGFAGDVAVSSGRIAAISTTPGSLQGGEILDATGCVVAPGFIDVHTHADRGIIENPYAINYVTQGVTTVVGGNCGGSRAPMSEEARRKEAYRPGKEPTHDTMAAFLDDVESASPGINFATFVGQGNVRASVMAGDERAPTAEEMNSMKNVLRGAIEEGAVGVTSGRRYMPGCLAADEEIVELMDALSPYGLVYSSHLKNQNDDIIPSIEELLTVAEANGIPVQLTHFKVTGRSNWGLAPRLSEMMEDARRRGIDVMSDVYPYTFSGSTVRRMAGEEVRDALCRLSDLDLDHVDLEGVLQALQDNGLKIAGAGTVDEEDMRHLLAHDYAMVGSDGVIADDDYGEIGNHPRSFGTFPRVLGHYARDCRLFTLERAVQKMTTIPAERLAMKERGALRRGWWADIVVFDEARISDRSTIENPAATASGIVRVYVNGREVVSDGSALCEQGPGKVLRYRGDGVS